MKYDINKIKSIVQKWAGKDLSRYTSIGSGYYRKKIDDIMMSSKK